MDKPEYNPRDYLMESINRELYEKDVRIWELEVIKKVLQDENEALKVELKKATVGPPVP